MAAETVSSPVVDAQISIGGSEWCFAKFQNQSQTEMVRNDEIICGHVDPEEKEAVTGREINMFTIWVDPTLPLFRAILEALGTTESPPDTFTSSLADTTLEVKVDLGGAVHFYKVSWLIRAVIRGQVSNIPVSMELQFIAQEETEVSGSYATFTPGTADYIFGFAGTVHTIEGVAYAIDRFAISINRNLVPEWNNANYVTGVGLGPRQTLIATTVPYIPANKGLYWDHKRTLTKSAIVLRMSNGMRTCTFTAPKAELMPRAPSVENVQQTIRLPMTWAANRRITATAAPAFTFVLDDTP
jgi:hypothetical protein